MVHGALVLAALVVLAAHCVGRSRASPVAARRHRRAAPSTRSPRSWSSTRSSSRRCFSSATPARSRAVGWRSPPSSSAPSSRWCRRGASAGARICAPPRAPSSISPGSPSTSSASPVARAAWHCLLVLATLILIVGSAVVTYLAPSESWDGTFLPRADDRLRPARPRFSPRCRSTRRRWRRPSTAIPVAANPSRSSSSPSADAPGSRSATPWRRPAWCWPST